MDYFYCSVISETSLLEYSRKVKHSLEKMIEEARKRGYEIADFNVDYRPTASVFGKITHNAMVKVTFVKKEE